MERGGRLHLFAAAPNALSFLMGREAPVLGATTVYEYDFDSMGVGAYSPGVSLPEGLKGRPRMELDNYFRDFLAAIRLTEELAAECQAAHSTLRQRLLEDEDLSPRIITTFLQGSYRRSTIVRPLESADRVDVDLVVVTNLHEDQYTPKQVIALLRPFLDRHYKGWQEHDRSVRLLVPGTQVQLDFVVTSDPAKAVAELVKSEAISGDWTLSEDPDWKLATAWAPVSKRAAFTEAMANAFRVAMESDELASTPLRIPSRDLGCWVDTNPIEQIKWTRNKNAATGGHFVNVVKSMKWWRQRHDDPKHPKGYPLEQLLGQDCDDHLDGVAEGLVSCLERIAKAGSAKPWVADPGVPANDVMGRVTPEEYSGFWKLASDAARQARAAYDENDLAVSATLWRELLGPEFPLPPERGGFTRREGVTTPVRGLFGTFRNG